MQILNAAQQPSVSYGLRFVSIVLIAGGILGFLQSIWALITSAREQSPTPLVTTLVSILVFAWAALKGVDLWRGKPQGQRWAIILFALQIPVFGFARMAYEFSTGLSARIIFGASTRQFGVNIGSSLNLAILPEPQEWMVGLNIFATVVVAYLCFVSRRARTRESA